MGSGLAAAAIFPELAGVGAPGLGGMQIAILFAAAGFFAVAWKLGRVNGKMILLVTSSMLALSGLFALGTVSDTDFGWMLWQLRGKLSEREPLAIHRPDATLGWTNQPHAVAYDIHYDYEVRYNIDEIGHRTAVNHHTEVTPSPTPAGSPAILCLGGSFTFGQGVESDQTYPALLDRLLPRTWQVVNGGVNGWGTVQAMLYLERVLKSDFMPRVVTYGFIPAHLARNADRESWLKTLAISERQKPVIKLDERVPRFDRLVGVGQGTKDSPELDEEEITITLQCLVRMDELCQQAGCRFYVLLLGNDTVSGLSEKADGERFGELLNENQIRTISLLDFPADRFPHDGHPTAAWHRNAAQRIADTITLPKTDSEN